MGLTNGDVEKLETIIKHARPLRRGEHVFHAGERFQSLYVIKTGCVKTYDAQGKHQVLGFHLPGDLVGLDAIDKTCHLCSAQVLESSAICELPFQRFEEIASHLPSLQHQMYRLLSKEISQETEILLLRGKTNAEERLAAFLLHLSQRLSKRGLSATDFYLNMSRNDISSYLGMAVETVSRLFRRFNDQGLLRVSHKHVEILDFAALERVSGMVPISAQRQRMP